MAEQAILEIQNLSSTATMALISIGMIYASGLFIISELIRIFGKWICIKIDKLKGDKKDNV